MRSGQNLLLVCCRVQWEAKNPAGASICVKDVRIIRTDQAQSSGPIPASQWHGAAGASTVAALAPTVEFVAEPGNGSVAGPAAVGSAGPAVSPAQEATDLALGK